VLNQCVKWDAHGLSGDKTKSLIDMHSIHIYTADSEHLANATAPRAAERAIQMTAALIDLARIENNVPETVPRQTICFDEWNVWDPVRAPGEQGAEEKYTLSDALAVAVFLNGFIRQAKDVGMANIAQSVNVISPLMTTKDGLVKQTIWWPLWLFAKFMRGTSVVVNVRAEEYSGRTNPKWVRGTIETPFLDVSASVSDDGWVSLAVANVSEEKDYEVDLVGVKEGEVLVYTVGGESVGVVNTEGEQNVGVKESKWDGKGKFRFGKHSFTMVRWKE
jgi:alpha-N-arabinofuranosidase